MEPFALFNLLKTLLPQTEKTEAPSSSANTQNPPSAPQTPAQAPTENAYTPPVQPNNSFVDFAERHDERARRIKKK